MVVDPGDGPRSQDRRHALANRTACRARNSNGIYCASRLLAGALVCNFRSLRLPDLTSAVTLTLCALAVAGAVAMILELEQGFGGTSGSHLNRCSGRLEP